MTYLQIEKLADEVFQKLGGTIPVDVVKAARLYDIKVFVTHMEKSVQAEPSGILVQTGDQWAIMVNTEDSITRQRFTIGHELGHFLIHKGKQFIDDFPAGETFYRKGEDTKEEREANYFASCILMPANVVEQLWPISKDPKDAAQKFEVSEVSMTYRLRNLELISIEE